MITIYIPDNFIPERTYIVETLFSEFLGLECRTVIDRNIRHYKIVLENRNRLIVRDHFFMKFSDGPDYLEEKEVPSGVRYSEHLFSPGTDIPVIFGDAEFGVEKNEIPCGLDIFSSAFFMLTRWEEYANRSRDAHGRFPAPESLACREGFLHRAVVNEYVEMLWNMLSYLRCGQERKKRTFRIFATHDVDAPFFYASKNLQLALRQIGGDLLKRKKPGMAFDNFIGWSKAINSQAKNDPFNTFDYIMDISEQAGLKSTFLFITDRGHPAYDGDYDIRHKFLRRLMRDINGRGHDIGLHLSYGSFNNAGRTKKEFDILKTICEEEGISQDTWTSRQHFLRWETPTTFNNLELAKMDYDSTLSYADVAGFRCGVCYEYPAFNILTRQRLNLREKPLLLMECTVMDKQYMDLGTGEKAFSVMKSIKDTCRRFNGDFTVLWHNTRFVDHQERQLYNQMLHA